MGSNIPSSIIIFICTVAQVFTEVLDEHDMGMLPLPVLPRDQSFKHIVKYSAFRTVLLLE
jgi:hypothetical protein